MPFQRVPIGWAIFLLINVAYATPPDGQLDPGFGSNGVARIGFSTAGYNTANLFGMAQPASGKLIVIGKPTESGEIGTLELARLLPGGTLDHAFGSNGQATAVFDVGTGRAIEDANGGALIILTVPSSLRGSFGEVCRLTSVGELDLNYNSIGCQEVNLPGTAGLTSGVLQSDGSLIVAGFATSGTTGHKLAALTRITATGAIDTSFASNGYFLDSCAGAELAATTDCELFAVTTSSDGRIYATGEIAVNSIDSDIIVLALTSGGALDPNFDVDGRATAAADLSFDEKHDRGLAIVVLPGGDIVVGGYAAYNHAPLLTRAALAFFDPLQTMTGGTASTYFLGTASGGYTSRIDVLALQTDGKLLIAGATQTEPGSHLQFAAERDTADGHLDANFGDGNGNLLVDLGAADGAAAEATVIVFDGTRPVIAGTRTAINGDSEFAVIRLTSELIFANGYE